MTATLVTGRPIDMDDVPPSPFELATAELRKLGITLARLPGEYRVNFHNGAESTAQIAETVDAALDLGRAMAAELGDKAHRSLWLMKSVYNFPPFSIKDISNVLTFSLPVSNAG